MHPQLELVDTIIRIIGWPTMIGMIIWVVRKWDNGQREIKELGDNTRLAVQSIAIVKTEVDTIKTNHLAHLQEGITLVAASNERAVDLLQDIKGGINVLV